MINQSNILGKTLTISVILLFIGVGVQPAIATVQIEEETGLSQKIRTQIDKLNPEYKDKFHKLYGKITTSKEEINTIKQNDIPIWQYIVFIILNIIFLPVTIVGGIIVALGIFAFLFIVLIVIGGIQPP